MISDSNELVTKINKFQRGFFFGVAVLRGAASAALVPQAGLSSYAIFGSCNLPCLGVQMRKVHQPI